MSKELDQERVSQILGSTMRPSRRPGFGLGGMVMLPAPSDRPEREKLDWIDREFYTEGAGDA